MTVLYFLREVDLKVSKFLVDHAFLCQNCRYFYMLLKFSGLLVEVDIYSIAEMKHG